MKDTYRQSPSRSWRGEASGDIGVNGPTKIDRTDTVRMSRYAQLVALSGTQTVIDDGKRASSGCLRCTLCDLAFKDSLTLVQHLSSEAHRQRSGQLEEPPATAEDVRQFFQTHADLSDAPRGDT